MKEQKNILIAGVGGQGVNTLYHVLQTAILKKGLSSKGAIFKGGAQKRGTVYAMIRIFDNDELHAQFSPMIPEGELDLLIALEVNEALRYSRFYNAQTTMIINDFSTPFYNERFSKKTKINPIDLLSVHFKNLIVRDYNELSIKESSSDKMLNVLIGLEAIEQGFLPVEKEEFLDSFQKKLQFSYEDMVVLMQRFGV